jgi:hypothetical protein
MELSGFNPDGPDDPDPVDEEEDDGAESCGTGHFAPDRPVGARAGACCTGHFAPDLLDAEAEEAAWGTGQVAGESREEDGIGGWSGGKRSGESVAPEEDDPMFHFIATRGIQWLIGDENDENRLGWFVDIDINVDVNVNF